MFVIADDFSGCTDAEAQILQYGLTSVSLLPGKAFSSYIGKYDCIILDSEARAATPEEAYIATHRLVAALPRSRDLLFKKIDSTFRGNIRAELEAMLNVTGSSVCPIVASYPRNGRTTSGGELFVDGKRIAETSFASDPNYPMRHSRLLRILEEQPRGHAGPRFQAAEVGLDIIRRGSGAISDAIHSLPGLTILDAETESDLDEIARAFLKLEIVEVAGSAGLLHAIMRQKFATKPPIHFVPKSSSTPILFVCGSRHPAAIEQTRNLFQACHIKPIRIQPVQTRDHIRETMMRHLADRVIVVTTPEEHVELTELELAETFDPLCKTAVEMGIRDIVVTGGWTALSVCERIGIDGVSAVHELEPGIAVCRSVGGETEFTLTIKPGGFGSPNVFVDAAELLSTN